MKFWKYHYNNSKGLLIFSLGTIAIVLILYAIPKAKLDNFDLIFWIGLHTFIHLVNLFGNYIYYRKTNI